MNIHTLGKPKVVDGENEVRTVRGHQSWAVLARLLLSDHPISRRKIASELFPNTVDPLGSLRWCLASLRRATGAGTLQGDPIELNLPSSTYVDIWNIDHADFDFSQAGEFLEGVEPTASAEFSIWLLIERERISGLIDARIRREAMWAISTGDFDRAIHLSELSVRNHPLEESGHILLAKSLAMSGKADLAIKHVEATELVFLEEFGEKPSSALRSAARSSICSPPAGVSTTANISSLITSGVAAVSAGAVDAGLDCLRRAAADADKAKDQHLHAKSLQELGSALVHAIRGFDDEGAILLRHASELAVQCGSQEIAASALRELGYVEALAGRRPSAASFLEQALAYSENDQSALAGVHAVIGFNLVDWGKYEDGLHHYEQSLEYARKAGNRRREIWSLGIGGWGQLHADQPDTAREWLESCLEYCNEIRWVAFQPWPQAVLAETRMKLRTPSPRCNEDLQESLALSNQLGDPCWEAANARALGLMCENEGNLDLAKNWMAKARNLCGKVSDLYVGLMVKILEDQIRIHSKGGDIQHAKSIARELLVLAARTHADAHLGRAMTQIGMPNPYATGNEI